jgi:hypothetical protein
MPQVVTIRPREVPQYMLILPAQKEFTREIAKAYSIVRGRQVFGIKVDSMAARGDTIGAPSFLTVAVPALKPLDLPPLDAAAAKSSGWCTPSWWCPQGSTSQAPLSPYVPADFPRR